jgi:exopolysaccharide biosynthesis polyprenyl glycosylphosphotransferase
MNPQQLLPGKSAPEQRARKRGSVREAAADPQASPAVHQMTVQAPQQSSAARPTDETRTRPRGESPEEVIRELEPVPLAHERPDQRRRDARYRCLLLVADALACAVGVVAAAWLGKTTHLTVQSVLLVALAPVLAKVLGLYDRDQARIRKSTLDELPQLIQLAALISFIALMLSPVVFGGVLGPREAIALLSVLFAGLVTGRTAARHVAGLLTPSERCLFIGPTDEAMRFRHKVEHDPAANAKLVAQIELQDASPWASPTVSERSLDDARELVRRLKIQRVIIAPHSSGGGDMLDLMRTFGAIGVRVSVIPAMLQVVGSAVEFDDVQGVAVLGVRAFSLSRSSRLVKRLFDVLGASVALVLLAPLLGAIALLVRFSSHGPVFFQQERIGRGGRSFELLKFRSMVADAEARKADLAEHNQAAAGFFKIADDPRITRVGRVLRRTNLDELPQLLNVLRGEMSLVGPRPLIPQEDKRVVGWHRRRLELTPGITGHWQVLGSSRVPLDEMVAIDYLYVANWSLWTDLKLLLRTIPHVLTGRGL